MSLTLVCHNRSSCLILPRTGDRQQVGWLLLKPGLHHQAPPLNFIGTKRAWLMPQAPSFTKERCKKWLEWALALVLSSQHGQDGCPHGGPHAQKSHYCHTAVILHFLQSSGSLVSSVYLLHELAQIISLFVFLSNSLNGRKWRQSLVTWAVHNSSETISYCVFF